MPQKSVYFYCSLSQFHEFLPSTTIGIPLYFDEFYFLCLFAAVELPTVMAVDEKKPEAAAAEATEDANGDQEGVFKGQLISECLFDVINFPKNQQKILTNFCPRF